MLKKDVFKWLTVADKIAGRAGSTLPILKQVKISTQEGKTTFNASNLNCFFSFSVDSESEINACVNAKKLKDLTALAVDEFSLKADKDSLVFKTKGEGKTKLAITDASQFPKPANLTFENSITVKAVDFCDAVKKCDCHAPEKSATILSGINLKLESGRLHLCSTDGYRLVHTVIDYDGDDKLGEVTILPEAAADIVAIFSEKELITLSWNESMFSVTAEELSYNSRVLSGKYPNYKKILPTKFESSATILKNALFSVIKRAEISVPPETSVVKLQFKENSVEVSAESKESSYFDSIEIEKKGPDVCLCVNIGYFKRMVSGIKDEKIIVNMNQPHQPVILKGVEIEDDCMIMPIKQ